METQKDRLKPGELLPKIKDFLDNLDNLLKSIDNLQEDIDKAEGVSLELIGGINDFNRNLSSNPKFLQKLRKEVEPLKNSEELLEDLETANEQTPPPQTPAQTQFPPGINSWRDIYNWEFQNEAVIENIANYNRLIAEVTAHIEKKRHELETLEFLLKRAKQAKEKALDSRQDWENFDEALRDLDNGWGY